MVKTLSPNLIDHPQDLLSIAADWSQTGRRYALTIVTGSQGGAVRANGALMLVPERDDDIIGYVSNGCIDADVARQARAALAEGAPRKLKYGAGSPFIDIRLPCGGAIDLFVTPDPDVGAVCDLAARLSDRRDAMMIVSPDGTVCGVDPHTVSPGWFGDAFRAHYTPKTKLRLAGRGAETLAFLKLAIAGDFEVAVQSPDQDLLAAAIVQGADGADHLSTPSMPVAVSDDPWTAFVMMFHDHDWEAQLLAQALRGPAFYIGALGSRRTHEVRCTNLKDQGFGARDLARIHAPIGMIPSLRDASLLAVSVLAEIVSVQQERAAVCA